MWATCTNQCVYEIFFVTVTIILLNLSAERQSFCHGGAGKRNNTTDCMKRDVDYAMQYDGASTNNEMRNQL